LPVVHDPAQVVVHLARAQLDAVLGLEIAHDQLVQVALDLLEIGHLAAGCHHAPIIHFEDALQGLVALGGAVGAQGVARDHHTVAVDHAQHAGAGHIGVLSALPGRC
jgi:hypothetical protein